MSGTVGKIGLGVLFGAAAFFTFGTSILAAGAIGAGIAFAGDIIGSLIPIPKIPSALSQQSGSQVYNAQSAQNQARLQDSKPVLYGRFKVYPDLISQPYAEYVNNEQVFYQLMGVTCGKANAEKILIGDTELASYSEAAFAVYQPGELINLFHCNVATNNEVTALVITGDVSAVTGAFDYSGSTVAPSSGSGMPFSSFTAGSQMTIDNTALNDGLYTIASVNGGGASVTIAGTFQTENAADGAYSAADSPTGKPIGPTQSRISLVGGTTGAFFAGPAGAVTDMVGVDVEFPRGLFSTTSSGAVGSASVKIKVEIKRENVTTWTTVAVENFTASSLTPQRFSRRYAIAAAAPRAQVRLTRLTPISTSSMLVNDANWTGLKGFIPHPTYGESLVVPDMTVLAVKVRVTGQLSGGSGRRINGIFQRVLPVYNGSAWIDQPTSSVVWADADVIRNTSYGLGKPDSALGSLADRMVLDSVLSARGDYFNGYFDRGVTIQEARISIGRCGRCVPLTDGRVFTLLRDQPRSIRTAMFSDRNIARDSLSLQFNPRKSDTPRGIKVAYHDPVSFQVKSVPVGDQTLTTDLTLFGCTSRDQAFREGSFVLNETLYRRLNVNFSTEMDGFVPGYGELVSVQAFWPDMGQATDVAAVASDGVTLTLDQPLDWSGSGPFAAQLRNSDGRPSNAIGVTRGADDKTAKLASAPPFVILTDSNQERTHFALSSTTSMPLDLLVRSIAANDEFHATVSCVLDDPRVHADPGPTPTE